MASLNFTTHNAPPNLLGQLSHPGKPWTFSDPLQRRIAGTPVQGSQQLWFRKCALLPTDKEWDFVLQLFHHQKPTTYGIRRIFCVQNVYTTETFERELRAIEARANDPQYQPRWRQGAHSEHRERIIERWDNLGGPVAGLGKVHVLPLWHGTSERVIRAICHHGFQILGRDTTDPGYFGRGIYFTTSARYAADVYSRDGNLLLTWVSMGAPFPVVFEDHLRGILKGQINPENQGANYIPAVPTDPTDLFCKIYQPTQAGQAPVLDEVVVFDKAQTVAAFWIELQPDLPFSPLPIPTSAERLLYFVIDILRHERGDAQFNEQVKNLLKKLAKLTRGASYPPEEQCALLLQQYNRLTRFFQRRLAENFSSPYIVYCQTALSTWEGTFICSRNLIAFPTLLEKFLPNFEGNELKNGWDYGCELLTVYLDLPTEPLPLSPRSLLKQFLLQRSETSLVDFAIQKVALSTTAEEVEQCLPLIEGMARRGCTDEEHERLYKILSSKGILEPLRERYLKSLPQEDLFNKLAKIPNRTGYRQKMRIEQEALIEQIEAITQLAPTSVKVVAPFFKEARYLKEGIIPTILDEQQNIKRNDLESAHRVCHLKEEGVFDLHLKQEPSQPMMEYAVYSLINRIAGKGVPPSNLVWFEVKLPDQTKRTYPVLASQTVVGRNLKEVLQAPHLPFDKKHLSHMQLLGILLRPGDGRASNFIVTEQQEVHSVDNDLSFVEPMVKWMFGFGTTVYFKSILYCLEQNPSDKNPLDPEVLQEWIGLLPDLILADWLNDLEARENGYNASAVHPFNFTLREGAMTTLYIQFYKLQEVLRQHPPLNGLDLLKHLITLRGEAREINLLGHRLHQYYNRAYRPNFTPQQRLQAAIAETKDQSVSSFIAPIASLGKVPAAEELKGRYSLDKVTTEFNAYALLNQEGIFVTQAGGKVTIHSDFSHVTIDGRADQERQELMIKGLTMRLNIGEKKPEAVALLNCATLSATNLLPFLQENLATLDLRGSAIQVLPHQVEQCPLERLYLSGCPNLTALNIPGILYDVPVNFPRLRELLIANCNNLSSIMVEAPNLQKLEIRGNRRLRQVALNLTALGPELSKKFETLLTTQQAGALKVENLFLSDQRLGVISAIIPNTEITELELQQTNYQDSIYGFRALANAIPKTKISTLRVHNIFTDGLALSQLLYNSSNLEMLVLNGNRLQNDGTAALASLLSISNISRLSLRGNRIGDMGAITLAQSLPRSKFKLLDLRSNNISLDGMALLANALPYTGISELHLSNNPIGDIGVFLLAEALPFSTLQVVDLAECGISDIGLIELATSLPATNISRLSLNLNAFGLPGINALAEAVQHQDSNLRRLYLYGTCYADQESVENMAAALRHSEIERFSFTGGNGNCRQFEGRGDGRDLFFYNRNNLRIRLLPEGPFDLY